MSLSRANFLIAFPEFGEVDTALVDAKLAEALRSIDAVVWDTRADDGQGYLTAHLLAFSPMGNAAKLVSAGGTTTYEAHYKKLVRTVAAGIRST